MTVGFEFPIRAEVRSFLDRRKQLLIGGDWMDAVSGRTFATHDPATETTLAEVAHGRPPTSTVRYARPATLSTTVRGSG